MSETKNLAELKSMPTANGNVKVGFTNAASFELILRTARMMSHSTLVPAAYQAVITKTDRYGNIKEQRDNPNALSNCVVVLNMAARMNGDPLMIAQNLSVIEGRPSWSSQWIIASINSCGRFSPIQFDIKDAGKKTVQYDYLQWESGQRHARSEKVEIHDRVCVAWVTEKESGTRIESPPVSIEMAVKEGWYTKNGSKWQTMPDLMLRYRSASFLGKLHTPELLWGLGSVEEVEDSLEAEEGKDGTYSVNVEALRAERKAEARVESVQAEPTATETENNEEVDFG